MFLERTFTKVIPHAKPQSFYLNSFAALREKKLTLVKAWFWETAVCH
jgi:hypothetical protein